jgi:curli biogenesis system outer membrane secretion channel CsgG
MTINNTIKALALTLLCAALSVNSAWANKITIAIGDIEYRAKDSSENKQYRAYGRESREDTRAFVDMVTTALVKTQKFDVIERDRMAEILKEQGLSMEGFANGGYDGSSFSLQGVDYILTGAITEFGESSQTFKVTGLSSGKRLATMAVDVRVLDVSNGSIGFAETVESTVQSGSSLSLKGFTSGNNGSSGALLGDVMRLTATDVTNLVVTNIYPIRVISVTKSETVMLNYGDGLLAKGDALKVFSIGEQLIDPDTGEVLGSEEELIATLEVTSAQSKFSKAIVVEGEPSKIKNGMLARVVAGADAKKSKKRTKKNKLW